MKGIDVSSHNGAIDWDKVRAAGTEFAILRAGYGKYASQQDSRFAANAEGCLLYTSWKARNLISRQDLF